MFTYRKKLALMLIYSTHGKAEISFYFHPGEKEEEEEKNIIHQNPNYGDENEKYATLESN